MRVCVLLVLAGVVRLQALLRSRDNPEQVTWATAMALESARREAEKAATLSAQTAELEVLAQTYADPDESVEQAKQDEQAELVEPAEKTVPAKLMHEELRDPTVQPEEANQEKLTEQTERAEQAKLVEPAEQTVQVVPVEADESVKSLVLAEVDDSVKDVKEVKELEKAAKLASAKAAAAILAAKKAARASARTKALKAAEEKSNQPLWTEIKESAAWAQMWNAHQLPPEEAAAASDAGWRELKAKMLVAEGLADSAIAKANANLPNAPDTWEEAEANWRSLKQTHQEIRKNTKDLVNVIKQESTGVNITETPSMSQPEATPENASAEEPVKLPKVEIPMVEVRKEDIVTAQKWMADMNTSTARQDHVSPAMHNSMTAMQYRMTQQTIHKVNQTIEEEEKKLVELTRRLENEKNSTNVALEAETQATAAAEVLTEKANEEREKAGVIREKKFMAEDKMKELAEQAKQLEAELFSNI